MMMVAFLAFVGSLVFFMSVHPKMKYTFWFLGILYWNNSLLFDAAFSFKSTLGSAFLIFGISLVFLPVLFVGSGIQTIVSGLLQKDYLKVLIALFLIVFTLLYYKNLTAVDRTTFDWMKFSLRTIIIVGTIFLFFSKKKRKNLAEKFLQRF
jgi:hypothetical protein